MKKICLIIVAVFIASHLKAQNKFTVKGRFKNYEGIVYLNAGKKDSVYTKNGEFVFSGSVDMPYSAHISIPSNQMLGIKSFWIDEGETVLELDTMSFKNSRFSGLDVKAKLLKVGKSQQIMEAFERKNNEIGASSLSLAEKNKQMKLAADNMLQELPNSVLSLYALSSKMQLYEKDELEKLFASFSPSLRQTYYGLVIKNKYIEVLSTTVGGKMPNFAQANQYGKQISLSDFKGKYVLVDFWASWCVPCRRENPSVVKAYKKFKAKGFDILAVSFDSNKEAWLKAMANDNLTWTHVSDLGGWQNVLAKTFKITAIPSNILIDKDGIILAKDLTGEELIRKLEEIFNSK